MRAIDADEMLKRLEEWNTNDRMDRALYNFTFNRILEQSTIEPEYKEIDFVQQHKKLSVNLQLERKKGKWVGPDSITYECSECGYSIYTIYGIPKTTSFCPNCGADMRKDGEANEGD